MTFYQHINASLFSKRNWESVPMLYGVHVVASTQLHSDIKVAAAVLLERERNVSIT